MPASKSKKKPPFSKKKKKTKTTYGPRRKRSVPKRYSQKKVRSKVVHKVTHVPYFVRSPSPPSVFVMPPSFDQYPKHSFVTPKIQPVSSSPNIAQPLPIPQPTADLYESCTSSSQCKGKLQCSPSNICFDPDNDFSP